MGRPTGRTVRRARRTLLAATALALVGALLWAHAAASAEPDEGDGRRPG